MNSPSASVSAKAPSLKWATWMVVISLVVQGCSLFVPGHQTVKVTVPEPPHCRVYINGDYRGEAPVTAVVRRNRDMTVMVRKDGYEPATRVVPDTLSTTGILDLIGAVLFLVPALGFIGPGAFSLSDTDIVISLEPVAAQPAGQPAADSKPEPH
ncbi:MAG: PEGA domain-containing protein [Verrucomicrobiota bacterium]